MYIKCKYARIDTCCSSNRRSCPWHDQTLDQTWNIDESSLLPRLPPLLGDAAGGRAKSVRCGSCHHCLNRHLKKGCMMNRPATARSKSRSMNANPSPISRQPSVQQLSRQSSQQLSGGTPLGAQQPLSPGTSGHFAAPGSQGAAGQGDAGDAGLLIASPFADTSRGGGSSQLLSDGAAAAAAAISPAQQQPGFAGFVTAGVTSPRRIARGQLLESQDSTTEPKTTANGLHSQSPGTSGRALLMSPKRKRPSRPDAAPKKPPKAAKTDAKRKPTLPPVRPLDIPLSRCLRRFVTPETLAPSEEWACPNCHCRCAPRLASNVIRI